MILTGELMHKTTQTPSCMIMPPAIWMIALEDDKAHIYKKTSDTVTHIGTASPSLAQMPSLRFLEKLSAWLEASAQQGQFHRLVTIGTPAVLDTFRNCASLYLCGFIAAEIAQDVSLLEKQSLQKEMERIACF